MEKLHKHTRGIFQSGVFPPFMRKNETKEGGSHGKTGEWSICDRI